MRTPWVGALICVLGFLLSLWVFFGFEWKAPADAHEKMVHEVFKFAITTVLVGGAALFYNAFRRRSDERHELAEREKAEREEQVEKEKATQSTRRRRLEEFLREFTDAYNQIKFVRRELRNAFEPQSSSDFLIDKVRYEELLRELNRGQLRLEQFRRILESKPAYLSFLRDDGVAWVTIAEEYLRTVTAEYENRRLPISPEDATKLVAGPKTAIFQYVVSRKNERHDGSSVKKHFVPLDRFFWTLAKSIEAQD